MTTFEIGIRHGNRKKKIFNQDLYEKERKTMTLQLASVLAKVFANNRRLVNLTVSYKNLICSIKAGLNSIKTFNGFPVYDYIFYKLPRISVCELNQDFDYASYDPIYCALVVKLIMLQSVNLQLIEFNPDIQALHEYGTRREQEFSE